MLRATNPSPYMYLLRFAGRETPFDVVGSSPEALVTVTGTPAVVHPPAGTRPRGATEEEDVRLAEALLADPKERAEHVMLVDLARNDLGRVCVPGTVEVPDFMRVEHYSHVMHLVSTVAGEVCRGARRPRRLRRDLPGGHRLGAPKPRAMEIIESLEPTRRALYAGTVGYVDASGDMDMAIAIRTAVLHQGRAYVQAGAGIVADSDPATEEAETRHKARACSPRSRRRRGCGSCREPGAGGAAGARRRRRGLGGRGRARADRRRPGLGAVAVVTARRRCRRSRSPSPAREAAPLVPAAGLVLLAAAVALLAVRGPPGSPSALLMRVAGGVLLWSGALRRRSGAVQPTDPAHGRRTRPGLAGARRRRGAPGRRRGLARRRSAAGSGPAMGRRYERAGAGPAPRPGAPSAPTRTGPRTPGRRSTAARTPPTATAAPRTDL